MPNRAGQFQPMKSGVTVGQLRWFGSVPTEKQ
jgi:hypothetical protein